MGETGQIVKEAWGAPTPRGRLRTRKPWMELSPVVRGEENQRPRDFKMVGVVTHGKRTEMSAV